MCDSCQALMINGVFCHETGCPKSWKDEIRECKWCGTEFKPEERDQQFDDPSCFRAYNNLPDEEDEE